MQRYRTFWPILSVFVVSLIVRITYNLTAANGYFPKYDARLYEIIANSLIGPQHCFCLFSRIPTTSRAPLWPWIIAAIYSVMGPENIYPRLFLCVLGSGTCVLIYLLARELFSPRIALVTGLLAAVYVGMFLYDGWLFSESLYTFLSTALVYALFRLQRCLISSAKISGSKWSVFSELRRWQLVCGALVGLASLTRPNGPVLYGILLIWGGILLVCRLSSWQIMLRSLLIIICVSLVFILPWTYRNYYSAHESTLVATGMGEVLAGAYNDTVVVGNPETGPGYWVSRDKVVPALPEAQKKPHHDSYGYTAENEKQDVALAIHWMRTHVSELPALIGWHFIHMWQPYTLEPGLPIKEFPDRLASQIVWYLLYIMSIPVFLLAFAGLIATLRSRWVLLLPIYLMLGSTIAVNLALYANMRFRAPIEPLLVLLVGGLLWRCSQMRKAST
ncbi:ArnT family glycosyltransferase [Tengunoibacter tsumagoiensis]|uniref:Glycosyltransferase RgtA/B/C/D-like domain-containing protein n=1 Tax=Tengunoibacter tsumagoiensis TaxID=2014871 RepID=A0A401ZVE5_9CHLR|nr:glycosyltransferase family 39 protein [Tengunoibacter tsumagoiensis]GCE10817.1 hypothetical protein KTT_06760 [Tengunoibacter tsumagoiensis]